MAPAPPPSQLLTVRAGAPAGHGEPARKSPSGSRCEHRAAQLPRVFSHPSDIDGGHAVLSILVRCFR